MLLAYTLSALTLLCMVSSGAQMYCRTMFAQLSLRFSTDPYAKHEKAFYHIFSRALFCLTFACYCAVGILSYKFARHTPLEYWTLAPTTIATLTMLYFLERQHNRHGLDRY